MSSLALDGIAVLVHADLQNEWLLNGLITTSQSTMSILFNRNIQTCRRKYQWICFNIANLEYLGTKVDPEFLRLFQKSENNQMHLEVWEAG